MSNLQCVACNTPLLHHIDADPNGSLGPVCARCVAEQNHDFDKKPKVAFDRGGQTLDEARERMTKRQRSTLKETRKRLEGIDDEVIGVVKQSKGNK